MVKAELKQGVGKKSGNPYIAVELTFPNGYKKLVFPENQAEKFVFENAINK